MRYAFIHKQQERSENTWPVTVMCKTLNLSRNGFYDYVHRLASPGPRAQRRFELATKITQAHADSRNIYGSPRIHRQLRLEGEVVTEKTVAKVMKTLDLQGKSPRRRKPRTTDSDHAHPIADNVLERDFAATGPNQKWVADITYIDTDEGWLYLAVVIDLFNAVSESFFGTLKTELDEPLPTRAIAHAKLFDYIEVFYNRQRLHSTLNYMSPAAYEQKHQAV